MNLFRPGNNDRSRDDDLAKRAAIEIAARPPPEAKA